MGLYPKLYNDLERFGYTLKHVSSKKKYYDLNLYHSYPFAPLLTSQGCPYRCSYCASHLLSGGYVREDPSEVIHELKCINSIGVSDFAFYDDALLVNADAHLKVILKKVIESMSAVRFHCPNGLHARFIDEELAYLMRKSGFKTLRLSLQTANDARSKHTSGKVTKDIFKSAVKQLQKYGFSKKHIGAYLMYGLPGQELEEVIDGVKFLKQLGVKIHLTEFSPIPATQCWKELQHLGTVSDTTDPLLTNNTVFSYLFSGYKPGKIEKLKLDVKQYNRV